MPVGDWFWKRGASILRFSWLPATTTLIGSYQLHLSCKNKCSAMRGGVYSAVEFYNSSLSEMPQKSSKPDDDGSVSYDVLRLHFSIKKQNGRNKRY